MISHLEKPHKKEDLLSVLHPYVKEWFFKTFKEFSLPQLYGVLEIHNKNNILISAPTGGTKTLTSTLAIINELVILADKKQLKDKVYCIYCNPLRALSRDIEFNLQKPLEEIKKIAKKHGKDLEIRIASRTGDTTQYERAKMLKKPPHILICTPESLAIILTTIKFRELLKETQYVIVDEIHALAENKRGTHLSLSLERLQYLTKFTRIGLSATIAPLEKIAEFLTGKRKCKIANIQFIKKYDLKVLSPTKSLIDTDYETLQASQYTLMDKLIQKHKTTLIFTNTRAATERVVHHLKEKFPKNYTENIDAHHGSLSKEHRHNVEDRLRKGELKVVVCSTSLELGIDIGYIDLVICLGSPKSIARAAQRCLPYDSKILLADGTYKEIGEIVENRLNVDIISYDKEKGFIKNKIAKHLKTKPEDLYSIKLKSGETIKCTKDHPILTKDGWKKADLITKKDEIATICDKIKFKNKEPHIYELLPHDKIFVENKDNFFQKIIDKFREEKNLTVKQFSEKYQIPNSKLIDCRRLKGRRKSIRLDYFLKACKITKTPKSNYLDYLKNLKTSSHFRNSLPLKLTKDLMWLAGIIASDGCIVETKTNKSPYYKIKIGNKSKKLIKESKRILNEYGFKCHQYERQEENLKNFINLECGSNLLSYLMFSLGIPYKNKTKNIEISNSIFSLNQELQHAYLEGVFEGDGNFNKGSKMIRIFTASKKFALDLHSLLNRLGYLNNINIGKSKTSKLIKSINLKNLYCVSITSQTDVKNFLNSTPIYGEKADNSKKFINNSILRPKTNLPQQDEFIHWLRIKEIRKIKNNKPLYNLTLNDPNNNFVVRNIITHNCGRAGHALHETVKGRFIVLDRDDLLECSLILKSTIERKIDKIHIPTLALDVLAQQIHGIAISQQIHIDDLFKLVTSSYPYKNLTKEDFIQIIDYLSGKYISLEDRHVYAKIWYNEETKFIGKKGKMSRVIHLTNIGTIPDQTRVLVKVKSEIIGSIDEAFLEKLRAGDVFILGGNKYVFRFASGMTAQVVPTTDRSPTVPSWFSEMLPLSFDLSLEIQKFRKYMEEKFKQKKSKTEILKFINKYLYLNKNAANSMYEYFKEQYSFAEIPHEKKLLIEFYKEYDKNYVIFHSLYGRRVNDVLSRAIAYAISRLQHRDVEIGINDHGFYISSRDKKKIQVLRAFSLLKSKELSQIMAMAIDKTEVLKRRFRHCATRSLMILRQYKGVRKRVGRQQVSSMILLSAVKRISENFPILKEARREVLEDLMDIENATKILKQIEQGKIKIKQISTTLPSPFSLNLVSQGFTDAFKMEDKIEFLRKMHKQLLNKIK